jgi:hypothetical protein
MIVYHGSSVADLTELQPHISEHKEPYIYFTNNIAVAALYTVHKVKRPYNWFPYGFDCHNIPVYNEYYPNALADVYNEKTGYIYPCSNIPDTENPTNINCAYVFKNPVKVDSCIILDDVYSALREYEKQGLLIVKRYEQLTGEQKDNIYKMIKNEIISNDLCYIPDCDYSKFLKVHFPKAWADAVCGKQ